MKKSEETILDVLADTNRILERIANALEAYNNAAIRDQSNKSDGYIQLFVNNGD